MTGSRRNRANRPGLAIAHGTPPRIRHGSCLVRLPSAVLRVRGPERRSLLSRSGGGRPFMSDTRHTRLAAASALPGVVHATDGDLEHGTPCVRHAATVRDSLGVLNRRQDGHPPWFQTLRPARGGDFNPSCGFSSPSHVSLLCWSTGLPAWDIRHRGMCKRRMSRIGV